MGKVEDALRSLIQYHGRRAARDVLEDVPERVRELRREVLYLQASVKTMEEKMETLMEERR